MPDVTQASNTFERRTAAQWWLMYNIISRHDIILSRYRWNGIMIQAVLHILLWELCVYLQLYTIKKGVCDVIFPCPVLPVKGWIECPGVRKSHHTHTQSSLYLGLCLVLFAFLCQISVFHADFWPRLALLLSIYSRGMHRGATNLTMRPLTSCYSKFDTRCLPLAQINFVQLDSSAGPPQSLDTTRTSRDYQYTQGPLNCTGNVH